MLRPRCCKTFFSNTVRLINVSSCSSRAYIGQNQWWEFLETCLVKLWKWFIRYFFTQKFTQWLPSITNIPNKQFFFRYPRLNLTFTYRYKVKLPTWTYKLCIRYLCFIKSWFSSQNSRIEFLWVNQLIVPTPNIPLNHRWTKWDLMTDGTIRAHRTSGHLPTCKCTFHFRPDKPIDINHFSQDWKNPPLALWVLDIFK